MLACTKENIGSSYHRSCALQDFNSFSTLLSYESRNAVKAAILGENSYKGKNCPLIAAEKLCKYNSEGHKDFMEAILSLPDVQIASPSVGAKETLLHVVCRHANHELLGKALNYLKGDKERAEALGYPNANGRSPVILAAKAICEGDNSEDAQKCMDVSPNPLYFPLLSHSYFLPRLSFQIILSVENVQLCALKDSPFHVASRHGNYELLEKLINYYGLSEERKKEIFELRDEKELSILECAASSDNFESARRCSEVNYPIDDLFEIEKFGKSANILVSDKNEK